MNITIYFEDMRTLQILRKTGILHNALRVECDMLAVSIKDEDVSKALQYAPCYTQELLLRRLKCKA